MTLETFTCPRCFHTDSIRRGAKFCPHCGLADAAEAAADTAPLELTVGGRVYRVLDRIAIGSVSTVYRCRFTHADREIEGVFKIARDPRANGWIGNEAAILRSLHAQDSAGKFTPFLPAIEATVAISDASPTTLVRQGHVLRMHEEIRSPDELYTLFEIRNAYPAGVDPRNVAWIWRRLLRIIGFAHVNGIVHGAVLPMHVLVEPREHKLLLIDWCCAVNAANGNRAAMPIIAGGHRDWYRREMSSTRPPIPALDIAFGARCMIDLLGGDPIQGTFPDAVDPGLRRHFGRCLNGGPGAQNDAWRMLDDFDKLLEALWGERRFVTLAMPTKTRI